MKYTTRFPRFLLGLPDPPVYATHTTKDAYTVTLHLSDGRVVRMAREDAGDAAALLMTGRP